MSILNSPFAQDHADTLKDLRKDSLESSPDFEDFKDKDPIPKNNKLHNDIFNITQRIYSYVIILPRSKQSFLGETINQAKEGCTELKAILESPILSAIRNQLVEKVITVENKINYFSQHYGDTPEINALLELKAKEIGEDLKSIINIMIENKIIKEVVPRRNDPIFSQPFGYNHPYRKD
jgi:hypothetical protein